MMQYRYHRITFFFARVLLSLALWEILFPRLGLKNWTEQTRSDRLRRISTQFRALAVKMGGVLIKVGQFMSARVDVLPDEITSELVGLQDEVPPENFTDICRVVEGEFGHPLNEIFHEFEEIPLAAASLGQVHNARILPGSAERKEPAFDGRPANVVVKVQRPDIETLIRIDLSALKTVGRWLHRYPPLRKRINIPSLIEEFTRILYEEIDYVAEAHNAEFFAQNFAADPNIRVPEVYWTHTTKRVLTLEDVRGIKITDYAGISAAGIDRGEVARRLLNTYLKQIFEDSFFHADPHPGNLFVSLRKQQTGRGFSDWQLTFVDFGMVGHVPPRMRSGLREMLIAVGTRDADRLVKAFQMLGVLLPGADLSLLVRAEEEIFDQFWGKNMSELQQIGYAEVQEMAVEYRQLIYTLPFQVPEDIILMGRTVGILSGMCTGLDPQFNLWENLAPFARKLVVADNTKRSTPWMDVFGGFARRLVQLPARTENMIEKVERGELVVRDPELEQRIERLEKTIWMATWGIVFAALLLAAVQLNLNEQELLSWILFAGAAFALVWILFSARKA